jgi:hypothetical protein
MKNSPIEGSITFYGMTIQQSLVNLGHVYHKFPCMGEIIFFKSQFGRNLVVENPWWNQFITRYQRDQAETKLVHHSF